MIDIVKIKQAVKAGELKIYVRDLKIYLQNDIGEQLNICVDMKVAESEVQDADSD